MVQQQATDVKFTYYIHVIYIFIYFLSVKTNLILKSQKTVNAQSLTTVENEQFIAAACN